jgi:TRAP-type C4-dicarboxylate transport system permease small subunit
VVNLLKLIDKGIEKGASYILVMSIFLMLGFSLLIIGLRWIDISIPWFESFVRHLVLLATFLGGVLATGRGTHIGIDILSKYLESQNLLKYKVWVNRIVYLACVFTLIWLSKACWDFMKVEMEYPQEGFLGISSGYLVGIIPVGFALITYRFFYRFVASFTSEGEAA